MTGPMGLGRCSLWSHQARFAPYPINHTPRSGRVGLMWMRRGGTTAPLCNLQRPACATLFRLRFRSRRRARSRQKMLAHSSPSSLAAAFCKQ